MKLFWLCAAAFFFSSAPLPHADTSPIANNTAKHVEIRMNESPRRAERSARVSLCAQNRGLFGDSRPQRLPPSRSPGSDAPCKRSMRHSPRARISLELECAREGGG